MTALCCPTCGHEVEQVPMKALADARMSRPHAGYRLEKIED